MATLFAACTAWGGESAKVDADSRLAEVPRWIVELDSPAFAIRDRAARQLEALVDDPHAQQRLADEFARVLASETTSFEVRAQLETLRKRLPPGTPATVPDPPSSEAIGPLIDALASDSSIARDSARRKLLSMLDHPELLAPLLAAVRQQMNAPTVSPQIWRALDPILQQLREAWVTGEPGSVTLPAVTEDQMSDWVDELAASEPPPDAATRIRRANARRELIDLVVRDDTRPRALALVNEKLAGEGENSAMLEEIANLARPAMAAEVWEHDKESWEHMRHLYLQHLLIGVPQFPESSVRATHFDRIDDVSAHCVSGNTLSEGDYPVGVAIPHPVPGHEVMYFLVNLPTPRRRVAYEFHMQRDERQRLAELSHQTLDHFLKHKHALFELEVKMLCQLDPGVVSRWIGPYFEAMPDRTLLADPQLPIEGMTLHRAICHALVRAGTREAIPVLEQTARSGRLGPPSDDDPFAIAWIAALAIARRDPWPGVDEWLMKLVDDHTELSAVPDEPQAELGATAAAILLERHELPPSSFGLEQAGERVLENVGFAGYRFADPASRAEVDRWWRKAAATPSVP